MQLKKRNQRKHRWCVHDINTNQFQQGAFHNLVKELQIPKCIDFKVSTICNGAPPIGKSCVQCRCVLLSKVCYVKEGRQQKSILLH